MNTHQIIIESRKGWRIVNWKEFRDYSDLFFFLVWRNIKVRYAQSVIGLGWIVIQPFFSMLVFTVVFGKLAKVESDGAPYAIFSFTGLVPWMYFSSALNASIGSLMSNAHLITKVYFPRLILPITEVLSKLVDFGIAMLLLFGLMAWFRVMPNSGVFMVPLLVLLMMLTAAGMGMWLTALAVQYRDVGPAASFFVQILMYASPVVYPASLIPEKYRLLYALNPMVGVIEGFRSGLLGTRPMPWDFIAVGTGVALVIIVSGIHFFRWKERIFADVA